MSNTHVATMTVCAFLASLVPLSIPFWVPLGAAAVAYLGRRPVLLLLAVTVLCSALAHRSWAGINDTRQGSVEGVGTVVSDPVRRSAGTAAVVRIDGARVLVTAWGGDGARLRRTQAGDRVRVQGVYKPYHGSRERKAALHVGTRVAVQSLESLDGVDLPYGPLYSVANAVRGRLDGGAATLSDERRALFKGLVYGDDRGQSSLTEADFRLAGLTHLLAVSGQNVAYVLTLAAPIIRRASLKSRWAGTVTVLVVFATITRFEPSVLRATVMAGLAATGSLLGRQASGGRLLGLAVTGLLVVDPLLASTIAFRLSVAASAGIAFLKPRIAESLPGPEWLAGAAAVTISAQLAVAPVLVTTFGPISLVSLPANVAAGPVAGATMTWGMTLGFLAGFLPASVAAQIHAVTSVLLWTLESIARLAAMVPIAPVGLAWIAAASLLVVSRRRLVRTRRGALGASIAAVILAVQLLPGPAHGRVNVGPSSEAWSNSGRTILILRDSQATTWLLDDLRLHGIRDIDLVITTGSPLMAQQATVVGKRVRVHDHLPLTNQTTTLQLGTRSLTVRASSGQITVE